MNTRDHNPDLDRRQRVGIDEAILCDSKLPSHLNDIVDHARGQQIRLLLTRLDQNAFDQLHSENREALDFDPVSRTAFLGNTSSAKADTTSVAIVSGGTSDVPVAREAARTLQFNNIVPLEIYDVGVAGLWRVMDRVDELRKRRIVIGVAGMDAALPTVLGGLIPGLIIAVPTSVGYGVAANGHSALNALLSSCASGLCVVNIDNGYGGACAAIRALNSASAN